MGDRRLHLFYWIFMKSIRGTEKFQLFIYGGLPLMIGRSKCMKKAAGT